MLGLLGFQVLISLGTSIYVVIPKTYVDLISIVLL